VPSGCAEYKPVPAPGWGERVKRRNANTWTESAHVTMSVRREIKKDPGLQRSCLAGRAFCLSWPPARGVGRAGASWRAQIGGRPAASRAARAHSTRTLRIG